MTSTEEEPPTKKTKTTADSSAADDWKDHKLNCGLALVKASEGQSFTALADASVECLQGIGPKTAEILASLHIGTIRELAVYKYYQAAAAICTLAQQEEEESRPADSIMNIDQALDKDYETKSLQEICEAPIHALQGLSEKAATVLSELHVTTVADLGSFKYAQWAQAIVALAAFEETETAAERKAARLAKNLS